MLSPDDTPLASAQSTHRVRHLSDCRAGESPSLLPGSLLDRYEILFELASGGMGTVYVARRTFMPDANGFVAIKRLNRHAADNDAVRAFLREAAVTAMLHHPNIVATYELGEHDGLPFIVMQLIQGVSLARLMQRLAERHEPLDPDYAARIIAQAATGLHAAHELVGLDASPVNLVHRDVSPQNILISYEGHCFVADFGIAKFAHADRATTQGAIKGKFGYMSPEQTEGRPLDRRSDIFALGTVLHETISGHRLFSGESPAETVFQILTKVPPPLHRLRAGVPESLSAIVARCLEKRPDARFPTAEALASALREELRERGSPVGELDVGSLVTSLFDGERQEFVAYLQRALVEHDRPRPSTAATVPMGLKARFIGAAAAFGILVVVLLLAWRSPWNRGPRTLPVEPTTSAPFAPAFSATLQPSIPAASSAPALPASASARPPPPSVRATSAAPRPPPRSVETPNPASSFRGVPFSEL